MIEVFLVEAEFQVDKGLLSDGYLCVRTVPVRTVPLKVRYKYG
jgi:hypothetical protein